MKAFGKDLRERILSLPEEVASHVVGERFCVSASFVRKLRNQVRNGGSMAPLPWPGRPRRIGPDEEEKLTTLVAEHSDATLRQLCALLAETADITISESALCRQFQRMGITLKKSR